MLQICKIIVVLYIYCLLTLTMSKTTLLKTAIINLVTEMAKLKWEMTDLVKISSEHDEEGREIIIITKEGFDYNKDFKNQEEA